MLCEIVIKLMFHHRWPSKRQLSMKVANINQNIHQLSKMIIVLSNTKKLVENTIQGQETS
jgi:hypothetical protein